MLANASTAAVTRRTLRQSDGEGTPEVVASDIGMPSLSLPSDPQVHARHATSLAQYKRVPERAAAAIRMAVKSPPIVTVSHFDEAADESLVSGPGLSSTQENGTGDSDAQGKTKNHGRPHNRLGRWELSSPGTKFSLLGPARRCLRLLRRSHKPRLVCALVVLLFLWMTWTTPLMKGGTDTAAFAPGPSQRGMFAALHDRRMKSGSRKHSLPPNRAHPVDKHGMLLVDPTSGIHPISQLMDDAARQWAEKVARQSKTLEEAIAEYKRRNHRPPPKGFDKWWKFVCENDVQLPDEYDQIHNDLHLFRSLSPRDLRDRKEQARKFPMTWTLSVRDGRYDTSLNFDPTKIHNTQVRINEQLDLIKDIVAYLPDFDAVYSIDDVPSQFIEWNYRLEMADHVDDQEGYFDARAESDFTYRGWQAGCSSVSPLGVLANRGKTKRGRPHDPKFFRPAAFTTALDKKTFIKDHRIAMDPCEHPELVPLHSVFASKSPTVGPLMPIFSLSKTTMHADILGVPTEQVETNGELIPWEQRNQDTLLWRGRTTGPWHKRKFDWRNTQRTRLVKMSNGNGNGKSATESSLRMLPPRSDVGRSTLEQEANAEDWERVNAHYMDVAFTGEPIQCDKADGSCKALADGYKYSGRMGVKEAAQYKYVIDIDGNAWSARFQRLIASGSVVFKSTVFPEWWTDRIQPWLHYVPVKLDYSDLYDSLAYFRGDLDGRDGHEDAAKAMASAALQWSDTHMRKVDMTAYVFRLYLEWSRLLANDREAANLVYNPDMEVTRNERA